MNKLFNESEVFIMERPKKLTEKQSDELYKKLAQEIIDNNWSNSNIEDIILDLQDIDRNDSGYEMAKSLEGYSKKGQYKISSMFIEWLECFDEEIEDAIDENVKQWVKAHSIMPKFETGTKLKINTSTFYDKMLKKDNVIFINGIEESRALYKVYDVLGSSKNFIIEYERLEEACEVCHE